MEILRIRSRIPLATLLSVCAEASIVVIPVEDDKGRQSYVSVLIDEVKPLNNNEEDCFFKGVTVPTNGGEHFVVDGATSMSPKKVNGNDYGHFAIYD